MPYKDIEQRKAHRRERYRKYKQQGLCVRCGKTTLNDNFRCVTCIYKAIMDCKRYDSKHKQEKVEYNYKKTMVRIKEGKCPRCNAPLIDEETKYCFACTTKTRPVKGVIKYEIAD